MQTAGYEKKSVQVEAMFSNIAKRYDLVNDVLSCGVHHLWRRRLFVELRHALDNITLGKAAMDLCTGTGDLLPGLSLLAEKVTGVDFCQPMLDQAQKRFGKRFSLVRGDALALPFEDAKFDIVTVSFGVRNFEALDEGLAEISRVLKPGGLLAVLEFGQPGGLFGTFFNWYSRRVMPFIGGFLSGDRAAYEYLPRTVKSFPCGQEFCERLSAAQLTTVRSIPLTFGLTHLYLARRD